MTSPLRRPAGALLAGVLTAGIIGVAPPAHAADGTISGVVTGPSGLLDGVSVDAYAFIDGRWQWGLDAGHTQTVDGEYTLVLPPGNYRIGFSDRSDHVEEFYDNAATVETAATLTLGDGGSRTASADLAPASHVTGTVAGPDGLLEGAYVFAWDELLDEDGNPYWSQVAGVSTDADGAYDLGGLAAGSYRISFEPDEDLGLGLAEEFFDDQPVLEGARDVTVDATHPGSASAVLERSSQISGVVTDASDAPVSGAYVTASVRAGDEWVDLRSTETGTNGSYTLRNLPKGTYRLFFSTMFGESFAGEYWNNSRDAANATDFVVAADTSVTGKDAKLVVGEHNVQSVNEPTISGTQQVGNTLTAVGSWTPSDVTVAYQWYRGETLVEGATAATYTLTAADAGQVLWVEVIASFPGKGSWYGWAMTGTITAAPVPATPVAPVPAPVPLPDIDFPRSMDVKGSMTVGSTITLKKYKALVSNATTTTTYAFQWFKGSKKIKKATKVKLKLTPALQGKKISVKVTAKVGTSTESARVKAGRVR